jgi:ferrous iron transport protein A
MGAVTAMMALVKLPRGRRAAVAEVHPTSDLTAELPARLRELGFLDGEEVKVLAAGSAGGPLAVRVGETTFALRRREAECVLVQSVPV